MQFHHLSLPLLVATGLIPAALGLCGCVYQYPEPDCGVETTDGVKVIFDWSNHPTGTPPGMSVYFYPIGDAGKYCYNLMSDGGYINLPAGTYDTATFNYDMESVIVISDETFRTLAFTTRPAKITDGLRSDYSGAMPPVSREEVEGQTVMRQPQSVWTTTAGNAHLTEGDSLTLTPRDITAKYDIRVTDIVNLHSVSRMSVSLSGLAGRYFASGGIAPDETAVIVPGGIGPESDTSLSGRMFTFGRAPRISSNTLRLYLWLTDGEKKVYEWEVGGQISSAPDPMNVTITVGGITLPDLTPTPPPPSTGGMEGDVDNWDVVNIELST